MRNNVSHAGELHGHRGASRTCRPRTGTRSCFLIAYALFPLFLDLLDTLLGGTATISGGR